MKCELPKVAVKFLQESLDSTGGQYTGSRLVQVEALHAPEAVHQQREDIKLPALEGDHHLLRGEEVRHGAVTYTHGVPIVTRDRSLEL